MKILLVATQLPFPTDTGGRIRTFNLLKHLAREHDLTFVCTVDPDVEKSALDEMRRVCPKFVPVRQKQWGRSSWRYFGKLLANFASPYPFGVAKDRSPALTHQLRQMLATDRFDVLVCDFLHASINLRGLNSVPTVLFQHNVEAEIFRRYYLRQANWLGKLFWLYQWKKMQRFEGQVCRELDCCIAVSETDRRTFQRDYGLTNVSSIDTGVDVRYFAATKAARIANRLVFTGSMDWLPNEDAMIWFVRKILPRIQQVVPDVSLVIVGRRPSSRVKQLGQEVPNVMVTGRVEDVRPFLAEAAVFIVPLQIGGGTRIKIFEAMASGIPVVSTAIGAEGLQVTPGLHILLADEPDSFAEAVLSLLQDPEGARQMVESARSLVAQNNDWSIVARQFAEICSDAQVKRKTS